MTDTTEAEQPPLDPDTSEATREQLDRAVEQGDAYKKAVLYMTEQVADTGGTKEAGDYLVGYAIEEAEGMYSLEGGELRWNNPHEENAHVEIAVMDASDGRFVPNLHVTASLVTPDGEELGPYEHQLVWHPMIYHYARNWVLPADGDYTLKVHIDPAPFLRHDEVNGRRFVDPVDVEFAGVPIERDKEPVQPPQ